MSVRSTAVFHLRRARVDESDQCDAFGQKQLADQTSTELEKTQQAVVGKITGKTGLLKSVVPAPAASLANRRLARIDRIRHFLLA